MSDRQEHETVFVDGTPPRLSGNVLMDGPDGRCIYVYPGIEERCPNDAVAHTYLDRGGTAKRIELCAEHASGDVPEPPRTEQQELRADGGQMAERTECREQHLRCAACAYCPSVAQIDGVTKLVCHCTRVGGAVEPVTIDGFDSLPDRWEFVGTAGGDRDV